jgi:hypothetical protein
MFCIGVVGVQNKIETTPILSKYLLKTWNKFAQWHVSTGGLLDLDGACNDAGGFFR